MLEVNKELWNATSYIYFEPLKIILLWQFESRKSAKSTKVSISIYMFVIKRNMLHTLLVSKNLHRTKRTKTVSSLKACQNLLFRSFSEKKC